MCRSLFLDCWLLVGVGCLHCVVLFVVCAYVCFFVVSWLLFVFVLLCWCCLLSVVRYSCWLFVVSCFSLVVSCCCLLLVVGCSLLVVRCVFCLACDLLFVVRCLLLDACLLIVGCCLLAVV